MEHPQAVAAATEAHLRVLQSPQSASPALPASTDNSQLRRDQCQHRNPP